MNITLRDILSDLHAAERELQSYEKKYGLRSDFFYDCFHAGLTEDAGNFDFQVWAGLVEAKRDLERRYRELILIQQPIRDSVKTLIDNGVLAESV